MNSDEEVQEVNGKEVEDQDDQMAFVVLLADFKVLFDKRQTPNLKKEKSVAVQELALCYSRNVDKEINAKQIMKKFNNMKTKVKAAADRKRTGNKKIVLAEWQQKFLMLWENEKGDNPVIKKVPGAVSAGLPCESAEASTAMTSPVVIPTKKQKMVSADEPAEFCNKSLQQLQRECLIQQIKCARAQEAAALEMQTYYSRKNSEILL